MSKYYRITAYHPNEDISVIMDSNGKFEKLWQFSACLVAKGFKIIEASNESAFDEGDLLKAIKESDKIMLRAYARGRVTITINGNQKIFTVNNLSYSIDFYNKKAVAK